MSRPEGNADWYVYTWEGHYYVVDTVNGVPWYSGPASSRDIAQAVLRGKMRD